MSDARVIQPLEHPLRARVRPPGSKSYTNRALVLAALADGTSVLEGALFSDDTRYMAAALRQLGLRVEADEVARTFEVEGGGGRVPSREAKVFIGNAGTAARFLPVLMALGEGSYELDGVPRMRERPIGPLLEALVELGAGVRAKHDDGRVPLAIEAHGVEGGQVQIPGSLSSQYITGLLLGGPYMRQGLEIEVEGELVSRPYVEMTLAAMRAFGVEGQREDWRRFTVAPGKYTGRRYAVEPDASAASYFFGAAAITGGEVTVDGLGRHSLQGDLNLVHMLEQMGCQVEQGDSHTTVRGPAEGRGLRGVEVNMTDLSDVAQTLAVVAAFAEGPTVIDGIGFIRRKETDRVGATATELRRLGATVEELDDGLRITPAPLHGATVQTYEDHRMAMSFALAGLRVPGILIADPGCTSKTFPDFFEVLDGLTDE